MKIAIFGGSFDPPHGEHVALVRAAIEYLHLDKVLVIPSFLAPHKRGGAHASEEDRLAMCRVAFRTLPEVEVSDEEIAAGGTSYSYLTCRRLQEAYPVAERYFLLGADMLTSFFDWYRPEEIVRCVTIAACGREQAIPDLYHGKFREVFGKDFVSVPYIGGAVSSTDLRVALAFPAMRDACALDEGVLSYIREKKLYRYPNAERALYLEKPERRDHSYRVAKLACRRAKGLGVAEEKALLASMLHDCGKYISPLDPLLDEWSAPEGVPAPVLHQFVGAYLAEHEFEVSDGEVLDAIRYHTSGRPEMGELEKLIFLSDMLEEARSYEGVDRLRALFWEDLDRCLCESLKEQIRYLKETGRPIYPFTEEAYLWAKEALRG